MGVRRIRAGRAAQLGWILAQWLIMQKFFFLQPVMLAAGFGVLVLAWLAHRGESLKSIRQR